MRHLYPKLLVGLIIGFVIFTVVGTTSHEAGHYIVAKYYGFDATIHYGYTDFDKVPTVYRQNAEAIKALRDKYKLIKKRGEHYFLADSINFPEKPYYETLIQQQRQILFPIHLGGPFQTMITGTIGLGLLILNRQWWRNKKTLSTAVWLVIFVALFWLRQSFNFLMAVHGMLVKGQWSSQMDEIKIANDLQLWPAIISLITGLCGLFVLAFVTLRVVPKLQRLTFIVSGLVGGSLGFGVWLDWLGPKLMP